jgi:pyridoxamine 5'-phosphate oxidase
MKASWCCPLPGSKLEGGYEEAKKWPQKLPKMRILNCEEDNKNLEVALSNFVLVVIDSFEVDFAGCCSESEDKVYQERGALILGGRDRSAIDFA